jgi:hypothetical protein
MVSKELKVYEKHGGDFLWGKTQVRAWAVRSRLALGEFQRIHNVMATAEETEEINDLIKKDLKEEILAIALLKWTDKKRYGNLQIGLKHSYLLGNNEYLKMVADVLKVLNNYKPEWTPPTAMLTSTRSNNGCSGDSSRPSVSFLQANGNHQVNYLRGMNDTFFRQISCRTCGLKGHYQSHCPVANSSGNSLGSGRSATAATSETAASGSSSNTGSDTASTPAASAQEHKKQRVLYFLGYFQSACIGFLVILLGYFSIITCFFQLFTRFLCNMITL